MKTLCVEGWRFLSHSYSIVNQWQLLSLMKKPDLSIFHRDIPFFLPQWNATNGLFRDADEKSLMSIPTGIEGHSYDALLRIAAPFNLQVTPGQRTVVFGTTETKSLSPNLFSNSYNVAELSRMDELRLITPSRWSREGFLRHGFTEEQVHVLPHGFSPEVFHPSEEGRAQARRSLNLNGFVFANFSAMTYNKGLDLLLRAFAIVCETHADCRLLLKGSDQLYPSKRMLEESLAGLPEATRSFVASKVSYLGSVLSMDDMANMYRAADAYVSPYRAEGFNMPPLEAAACGIPVICTAGGSTDDFMDESFALRIQASPRLLQNEGRQQEYLEPDLDHLVSLMLKAVEDEAWRQKAARLGVAHMRAQYSWDQVTDRLCQILF
jgi:glycosyltransferase involved in cell wall biosynthesis